MTDTTILSADLRAARDELLPIVVRGTQRIGELALEAAMNGDADLSRRYSGAERYLEILVTILGQDGFVTADGVEVLKIAREFVQGYGSMPYLRAARALSITDRRSVGWWLLESDGALKRDGGRVWLFAA